MKKILLIFLAFLCLQNIRAQIERAGGGLAFSTGVDFNTIETGNPGFFGKAYIKVLEDTYLVPTLTVFNRYKRSTVIHSFTNYMFQADLDVQYEFLQEGPLRVVGFAGINGTGILSKYEIFIGESVYDDDAGIKPGLNLGGGVEMYIDKSLDSVLSAKYIVGPWNQFVIQLSVIYHFYGRKRIGW